LLRQKFKYHSKCVLYKGIVDKHGFNKPILVTSAFHMKRAVKQFEKNEVNVIPYPTDYQTNSIRKITLWILFRRRKLCKNFIFLLKNMLV